MEAYACTLCRQIETDEEYCVELYSPDKVECYRVKKLGLPKIIVRDEAEGFVWSEKPEVLVLNDSWILPFKDK